MRLGTDPEVFLQDSTGKHISSIGYINADKWHPLQIPDMPEGFTLQEDNVSLEYGVPPASSSIEFIQHIRAVMEKSLEYIPGLSFSKLSAVVFPDDQLNHPMSRVFGCEPDFNAWTKETNFMPRDVHPNLRSAGGHVHVESSIDPIYGVKLLDLFLGVPSTLMDSGEQRKLLYGKAGAHRTKSYGFEYRTLSNFWIFEDPLIEWVWNSTEKALASGIDVDAEKSNILEAINNNNKEVALSLVNKYNLEVI